MKPIIKVENLSKKYKIGGEKKPYSTLRESLVNIANKPFNVLKRNGDKAVDSFWALQDVSFEVMPGEIVGVIGRNGAGKSTLLKILSRITEPTIGKIELYGRIGSLLEVGTGFHPELSGRENIFLNGVILGMQREEIIKKFDEIVDFAEIEKFLDTPVKHYSSGMYTRLAFAVASHLDLEILVIDEVLAVGDAEFQKKCLGKMQNVSSKGRTVLFVSHNLGALRSLCSKGIVLDGGKVITNSDIFSAIEKYSKIESDKNLFKTPYVFKGELKGINFTELNINDSSVSTADIKVSPNKPIVVEVGYEICDDINVSIGFGISKEGNRISTLHDFPSPMRAKTGKYKSTFIIPEHLLRPGNYNVSIGGYQGGYQGDYIWAEGIIDFEVLEEWSDDCQRRDEGIINIKYQSRREAL